ncbi:MAG: putative dehydrogenase, partial [Glaciecola sp.]
DKDATIYALRSRKDAPKKAGIIDIYSVDEIDFKVDFALISNSTHLHFEWIENLTELKCPMIIEKPAIHTLLNSDSLVDNLKISNTLSYVACNLRFHPCVQFIKSQVTKEQFGRINEVNVYCGSYLPDWRPNKDFRTMYSANIEMGGGVHLDLFHELDYTCWIFGIPPKHSSTIRSTSSLAISASDYASYVFEYPEFTANLTLNYYRRKPKREIEIVSQKGTYTVDLINNKVVDDNGEILFSSPSFNIMDTYVDQMAYFVDLLNSGSAGMNDLAESVEILKICLKE